MINIKFVENNVQFKIIYNKNVNNIVNGKMNIKFVNTFIFYL